MILLINDPQQEDIQFANRSDVQYVQNQIQLKDKLVEPDKDFTQEINRNIQLGYIKAQDHPYYVSEFQIAKLAKEVPPEEGGIYVMNWLSDVKQSTLNFAFTSGLSIEATGRQLNNTQVLKNISIDNSSKGGLADLMPKKQVQ